MKKHSSKFMHTSLFAIFFCCSISLLQAQYYTGRLTNEFSDSLKNLITPSIAKSNKLKTAYVYQACGKDSVPVFKSTYDENGNKTMDEIYEKGTLAEIRKFHNNRLYKIVYTSGREMNYKYYPENSKKIDSIIIYDTQDTLRAIHKIINVYNSKSILQSIVYSDYLSGTIDTVELSYAPVQREKYLRNISIETKKHSVSEYLLYKYNSSGQLTELKFTRILIGSKRYSMVKKVNYHKNGLVSMVKDNPTCNWFFVYNTY